MSTPQLVTLGHAIVDVLGHSNDQFIASHGLTKGVMQLVEADQGVSIYDGMAKRAREKGEALTQISGGSAANTAVVAAMLGTPSAFIGKVNNDPLGDAFIEDIRSVGVHFATMRSETDGPPTGPVDDQRHPRRTANHGDLSRGRPWASGPRYGRASSERRAGHLC